MSYMVMMAWLGRPNCHVPLLSCSRLWPQEPVPHGWILNPDSNTRISWDLGSLIMVLYDMVMIPMQAYDARQKTKWNAGNVYESSWQLTDIQEANKQKSSYPWSLDHGIVQKNTIPRNSQPLLRIKPLHLEQQKQRTVDLGWNGTHFGFSRLLDFSMPQDGNPWRSVKNPPGDSKWWFRPLVGGCLNLNRSLDLRKRSPAEFATQDFFLARDVSILRPLRPAHTFGLLFGSCGSW